MAKRNAASIHTVAEDNGRFYIVHRDHEVTTPIGNPLRTPYRDLAEEVADNLERNGPDPTAGTSMYACLCSLIDFGTRAGRDGLIASALVGLRDDPILHTSADPEVMSIQIPAYSQPYFQDHGLRGRTPDDLVRWAAAEMASWSMEEIMAVQLVAAHIDSPLMGMALAQNRANLTAAAFGFCGRFWHNQRETLGGIWSGWSPQYYPSSADENFCESVCLLDADKADNETSQCRWDGFERKCGVAMSMDVWRRFAASGRKVI